jgi:hypothetical protein
MPLPTFASLDEVPDAFRSEYELVDGKAVSKDFRELRTAAAKERAEREAATKALKDAEKRLADLEAAAKAKSEGISDEKLAALRDELEKKLAPERQRAEAAESKLRALQLDATLKSLMASKDVGVRAERIDTLWRLIGPEYDLTDGGTPILKADPTADVAKSLAGRVKEFPEFFVAPDASGGGATGSKVLPATRAAHAELAVTNPERLLEIANTAPRKVA